MADTPEELNRRLRERKQIWREPGNRVRVDHQGSAGYGKYTTKPSVEEEHDPAFDPEQPTKCGSRIGAEGPPWQIVLLFILAALTGPEAAMLVALVATVYGCNLLYRFIRYGRRMDP